MEQPMTDKEPKWKPDAILIVSRDPLNPAGPVELASLERDLAGLRIGEIVTTTACVDLYQLIDGEWRKVD